MSAVDPTLSRTIRDILAADGKIGTATLVAQLQKLGFTSLPTIWKTLELLERTGEVRSVLIVGCGFIGVELALLLSDLGATVTVLGRRGWVMPRMLDPQTAALLDKFRHGQDFLRQTRIRRQVAGYH
ncbi:MAG: NAD-binding protein, partial [Chloroflexales bacterium]|nr:NAD-binding protein [Chloroflexales bacterium]